eukprot:TRINITY_DN2412_c0_g1_i1.p1 TRINITY_DN2412_c0_g1~~TRINITY_DN2412_c0_g1_i1.p1  ORF type:complete len:223 (-),score=40.54 TRINITY_DN2412_c0_g1_i1:167-799(-)
MPSARALVVALVAALLSVPVDGFYFFLDQKLCFVDELGYDRELVHVHYLCPQLEAAASLKPFIKVTATDPNQAEIHTETVKKAEGTFTFLSTGIAGEYNVCFEPSTNLAQSSPHLAVEIENSRTINWNSTQTVEKLSLIDAQLKTVRTDLFEIRQETQYIKRRQLPFHSTNQSTHRRVWAWALVQVTLLVLMPTWQIFHLKSFFLAKKLV